MDDDKSMVESESSTCSSSLEYKHHQSNIFLKIKNKNKKNKRTRRGGKKHSRKNKVSFSLLGNNAAGLKAKKDSLEAIIIVFKKSQLGCGKWAP